MSLATNASGAVVSRQDYDPWGSLRTGGISQTTINYTGQRRDGTGLLYYHARYYDPVLARFISADSVVPGAPDGSMDGVALKPLTVDFHETGFVTGLNAEHGQGFWFQNTDQIAPWGPPNPQGLNRYAYVQNNPLRYTDPSGHTPVALGLAFFIPGVGQAALLAVGAVVLVGSVVLLVDAGIKIYNDRQPRAISVDDYLGKVGPGKRVQKHYEYPDQPGGYSQAEKDYASIDGVETGMYDTKFGKVRVKQSGKDEVKLREGSAGKGGEDGSPTIEVKKAWTKAST